MATAAASSSADLGGSPAAPKPPSPRVAVASAGASNNSSRSLQQRKRKRLNAVLDKISNHVNGNYATPAASSSNSSSSGQASSASLSNSENNNEVAEAEKMDNMFGRTEQTKTSLSGSEESTAGSGSRVLGAGPMAVSAVSSSRGQKNNAALRRELWRDNPQQSVNEDNVKTFRFDSQDRERYFSGDSMLSAVGSIGNVNNVLLAVNHEEQEQDVFSPGRSPHSSMSSPQVSVDSPRICFSPLRIKVTSVIYIDIWDVLTNCPKKPQILTKVEKKIVKVCLHSS